MILYRNTLEIGNKIVKQQFIYFSFVIQSCHNLSNMEESRPPPELNDPATTLRFPKENNKSFWLLFFNNMYLVDKLFRQANHYSIWDKVFRKLDPEDMDDFR